MTKKRAHYSDEFKAEALVILEASGYPDRIGAMAHAVKSTGIPESTLRSWHSCARTPPPAQLCAKKRLDLRAVIRAELEGIFNAMPAARPAAAYRELATAAGILIDKLQILEGQPTWRVEIVNLLRDGTLPPDVVETELGNELARELFDAAGVDRA